MNKEYRKNGFRKQPELTKSELVQKYDERLNQLEQTIRMVAQLSSKISEEMIAKVQELVDIVDYRSLATVRLLSDEKRNIFTMDELDVKATALRIEEFDAQSKKDDETKGLVILPEGSKSKITDHITIKFTATDIIDKKIVLDSLRSKIELGANSFAAIEKELVGLAVGDKKTFTIKLGPEFSRKGLAGKEVEFKVEVFDLKAILAKPAITPETIKGIKVEDTSEDPAVTLTKNQN